MLKQQILSKFYWELQNKEVQQKNYKQFVKWNIKKFEERVLEFCEDAFLFWNRRIKPIYPRIIVNFIHRRYKERG